MQTGIYSHALLHACSHAPPPSTLSLMPFSSHPCIHALLVPCRCACPASPDTCIHYPLLTDLLQGLTSLILLSCLPWCRWRGTDGVTVVAVKGATAPHLQQLLRQEVEVYQQLQELQGTSIPKLLAHGPGLNGIGYFLVLQYLPGTALFPSTHGEQLPIRAAAAAA